jgi:ketosteroid isomerase-like protein
LILVLSLALAAASPDSAKAAILSTVQHMEDAWNRGDFRGYMAGFENPDVVFVSGGKFQVGRARSTIMSGTMAARPSGAGTCTSTI